MHSGLIPDLCHALRGPWHDMSMPLSSALHLHSELLSQPRVLHQPATGTRVIDKLL